MASIHFDGKVLNWSQTFLMMNETGGTVLWNEFMAALVDRFGEQLYEDPVVELKKLSQVSSLQFYLEEFDLRLCKTNLRCLLGCLSPLLCNQLILWPRFRRCYGPRGLFWRGIEDLEVFLIVLK